MLNESTPRAGVTTGILCQSDTVRAKIRANSRDSLRDGACESLFAGQGGFFVQEVVEIERG
jgi:hypothetical protein